MCVQEERKCCKSLAKFTTFHGNYQMMKVKLPKDKSPVFFFFLNILFKMEIVSCYGNKWFANGNSCWLVGKLSYIVGAHPLCTCPQNSY